MKILRGVFIGLMLLFLYAPLLVMTLFSFNSSKSTSVFEGFSLKWYEQLLYDSESITALQNTLVLAILSALIATVLGTVTAVAIFKMKKGAFKSTLTTVTNIPMMTPEIVTGFSLMLLFVSIASIIGRKEALNFGTILCAHITFNLPYVILNVLPKLKQTDANLSEAAEDLGCTPLQAFFKSVLPAIYPGIFTGFIMSFTLSLDDFVISYFTSGPSFQTLPIRIYSMTKKTVKPTMYALSTIIFLTVLVLLILVNLSRSESQKSKLKPRLMKALSVIVCVVIVGTMTGVSIMSRKLKNTNIEVVGDYGRDLAGTTLNVYNWGEYLSLGEDDAIDVNAAFEKLTGIKVNYTNFESNEEMYAKIKAGSSAYDIIIPSDYMIQRMIREDLLLKLDFSEISNYSYIADEYKNLYFDPKNEYSVPYNVGMVGLIYNKTMVEEAPDSWEALFDSRYKGNILTFNNSRDAFAIAQFALGLDINSLSKDDWNRAADKLKQQNSVLQARVMDEVFNKMESGNAALAPYYAGDFYIMKEANDDLEFVYPKEGTNIFVDSVCVPKTAQNFEAAMMYINFLLEPEVALANAEYICYASPNTSVIENEEYTYKDDPVLYPSDEVKKNTQYFHDIDPEIRSHYEKLWMEVKLG